MADEFLEMEDKAYVMADYDMLIGNINKMCTTKDMDELRRMHDIAKERLDALLFVRAQEIS